MSELFPILAGLAIGLVVQRISGSQRRAVALFLLSVLAGLTASFISGELFVSWDFLLFDIPLVFASAVALTLAIGWWRRRAAASR